MSAILLGAAAAAVAAAGAAKDGAVGVYDALVKGHKNEYEARNASVEGNVNIAESSPALFQEQCYLIENMKRFEADAPAVFNRPSRTAYVTTLDGDPETILNSMIKKSDLASFFCIKPYQLASLVPNIRLYKTAYDPNDKQNAFHKEFVFQDYTNAESIENITKTARGRGEGVGIKDVKFEFMGRTDVENRHAIQIVINFHFQSLRHLTEATIDNDVPYLELFENKVNPKDHQGVDENGDFIENTRQWDPKAQMFTLSVGWAVPRNVDLGENSNELKSDIAQTRTILLMSLWKHKIDFKQDGSINLECRYTGGISSLLLTSNSDILIVEADQVVFDPRTNTFVSKEEFNALTKSERRISGLEANIKQGEDLLEKRDHRFLGTGTALNRELTKDEVKNFKEKLKKERATRDQLTSTEKKRKYNSIITEMLKREKIYSFDLSHDQVKVWHLGKDINAKAKQALIDPDQVEQIKASFKTDKERASFSEALKIKSEAAPAQDIQRTDDGIKELQLSMENASETAGEKAPTKTQGNVSITTPKGSDKVRVNYFYFGDLVDVVAEIVEKNSSKIKGLGKDVRILLGPMFHSSAGQQYITSMANIPISLDLFSKWFVKDVVASDKAQYMLDTFLRKSVQTLVIPAMQPRLGSLKGKVPKINLTPLYARTMSDGSDPLPQFPLPGHGLLHTELYKNIKFNPSEEPGHAISYKNYMFINIANYEPNSLDGIKENDVKKGVYHINLGSDCGLVKEVKFEKVDDAQLEAAIMMEEGQEQKRNLMKGVYKANVRLVGTTAFTAGSLLYINPTMIGFGGNSVSLNEVIKKTGLGGYFKILRIEQTLNRATFETNLDCIGTKLGYLDGEKTPSIAVDNEGRPIDDIPSIESNPRQ